MSALISRRSHSPVAARVRRLAAALAAAGAGLLAWIAAVPAASASIPMPYGQSATDHGGTILDIPGTGVVQPVIRVVQGGGMPGWQIAAIAIAAALVAAAAAVFLDRAWSSHHPAHTV
jgi:hypothetical protein